MPLSSLLGSMWGNCWAGGGPCGWSPGSAPSTPALGAWSALRNPLVLTHSPRPVPLPPPTSILAPTPASALLSKLSAQGHAGARPPFSKQNIFCLNQNCAKREYLLVTRGCVTSGNRSQAQKPPSDDGSEPGCAGPQVEPGTMGLH